MQTLKKISEDGRGREGQQEIDCVYLLQRMRNPARTNPDGGYEGLVFVQRDEIPSTEDSGTPVAEHDFVAELASRILDNF